MARAKHFQRISRTRRDDDDKYETATSGPSLQDLSMKATAGRDMAADFQQAAAKDAAKKSFTEKLGLDTSGTTKGGDLKREAAQEGIKALGLDDGSTAGGALGGAASGAVTGSKFGAPGAIIGGVIGGISGGMAASAKQKAAHQAAKQRAKAEHANNLANIEKDKDRKIQNALESMKGAFSKNLQSSKSVKL